MSFVIQKVNAELGDYLIIFNFLKRVTINFSIMLKGFFSYFWKTIKLGAKLFDYNSEKVRKTVKEELIVSGLK